MSIPTDAIEAGARAGSPRRTCSFDGCEKEMDAKGLCNGHYYQYRSGRELKALGGRSLTAGMTTEERFWFYVDKSGECWTWTGHRDRDGYGRFEVGGRQVEAYTFAWELQNGPILRTKAHAELDHKCHRKECVRPDHLQAVSAKQNQENTNGQCNSKTGVRGVFPNRDAWQGQVKHDGRTYYVGRFKSIAEAESAVRAKRNELYTNNLWDRDVAP